MADHLGNDSDSSELSETESDSFRVDGESNSSVSEEDRDMQLGVRPYQFEPPDSPSQQVAEDEFNDPDNDIVIDRTQDSDWLV